MFAHPLWLVGFRPFFALACLAGALLPVAWVSILAGIVPPPPGIGLLQWHAHEMFFGFGGAVLGGFLLTASKNWVKIRGYHGGALALLSAAWLGERAAMALGGNWPHGAFFLASNLFLAALVAMLCASLLRHRRADSYRSNVLFLIVLPLFIVAKQLLLDPAHFAQGAALCIALFRMAFLIMLERTLSQFMASAFRVEILRNPVLDGAITGLGLALVPAPWLPEPIAATLRIALAFLLLVRFPFWQPRLAFRRIDIGVMYLGYLGIVAELLVTAFMGAGTLSTHLFTFGVMGLIIPTMIIRIAKGHTGRPVGFDAMDRGVLRLMIAGAAFRLAGPPLVPALSLAFLALAAGAWCLCFSLLAVRYLPFLLTPRVDGREH